MSYSTYPLQEINTLATWVVVNLIVGFAVFEVSLDAVGDGPAKYDNV